MLNRLIPALFIVSITAVISSAVTIRIPLDYAVIQAGINAAQDGDTVLIADGVYTGTGNKNINFSGKEIAVKSLNGPGNCIIDCQNIGRGFIFCTGEDSLSVLEGITVKNGESSGIFFSSNGSPLIKNSAVIHCEETGIFIDYGSPIIDGCLVYDNSAERYGGGIAIYGDSAPHIRNSYIIGNYAPSGGGIYGLNSADTYITGCYICFNSAGQGGGLFKHAGVESWFFDNCIFSGNRALSTNGGAIMWHAATDLFIGRTSFIHNYANNYASGISFYSYDFYDAVLQNCTFVDNQSEISLGVIRVGQNHSLAVINSIFYGNIEPAFYAPAGCDLTVSYSDIEGGWVGTGNFDANPLFVSEDNWDIRLQPDSPCIDAGDPASPLDPDGTIADVGSQYFDQNALARVLLNSKFRPLFVEEGGGSINLPLQAENFSTSTLELTLWNEIYPPYTTGSVIVWGPRTIELAAQTVLARNISQNFTARMPSGIYPYYSFAVSNGDTLTDNCLIIKTEDFPESHIPCGLESAELSIIPDKPVLHPPYPNPCNNEFTIEFSLPEGGHVNLAVYDITGRLVDTIEDDYLSSGDYTSKFSGMNFSSGIYFVKMQTGTVVEVRKLVLMK